MKRRALSLGQYRDLPQLAGGWRIVVSFFARLPTSMVVIGILTLITATTGSVAQASVASATLAVATGIGQPMIGRITDRVGQRVPLLILAPINTASLVGVVVAASAEAPLWLLATLAAFIGASTPPVGALARVRWYKLAKRPPQLAAALSWETTIDELAYVLGPALVGVVSSMISPFAPLLVTAAFSIIFVTLFALSPNATGPSTPEEGSKAPSTTSVAKAVAVALIAMAGLGMFFGAMQTSTTAFATSFGSASESGLIYAAMGLGSAITALGAVLIPESFPLPARIAVGGVGIAAGALLCSTATGPIMLAAFMFLTGMAIGPASVAIFTLAGRLAPRGGDALAVTLLGAMNVIGVAVSSALAGQLLEINITYGYILAACSGLLMAASVLLRSRKSNA